MPLSNINGVNIFWELTGSEPLIQVHRSWGEHQSWDMVVPALSKTFRVLTYDRRGQARVNALRGRAQWKKI